MKSRIRILVAEDHLIARVGVTSIINMQSDMKVVAEAVNGQQALQLFRKPTCPPGSRPSRSTRPI